MGLDAWMPSYDVRERHRVRVKAGTTRVWEVIRELDLEALPLVRAIVRAREWVLGAKAAPKRAGEDFFARMAAMGWGKLEETPGELVMGALTRPWEADVVFVALEPGRWVDFAEAGWVKIVWGIRVEERGGHCEVITETRAGGTDEAARKRFLNYWAWIWPGVKLIRWALLWEVRRRAEGR